MVLTKKKTEETQMEVDEPISSTSTGRPTLPLLKPAKPKDYNLPSQAHEAGMR